MKRSDPFPFELGQALHLRKPHPCGNLIWDVERVGADIQIRCRGCQHRQTLPRRKLEAMIRRVDPPPQAPDNERNPHA